MSLKNRLFQSTTAALVILGGVFASNVQAAPLVQLSLQARPTGSSEEFSSSVAGVAGQSYDYRVIVKLASVGTTNTQGATVRTINSINAATDGVNSLSFRLFQSSAATAAADFETLGSLATTPTADASWTGASQPNPGTLAARAATAYSDINSIRPQHASGVYSGADSNGDIAYTGTFKLETLGDSNSVVNLAFASVTSGFRINGTTTGFMTTATESGVDPIAGYTPLTITATAVPEPATLGLAASAVAMLLARRRRQA